MPVASIFFVPHRLLRPVHPTAATRPPNRLPCDHHQLPLLSLMDPHPLRSPQYLYHSKAHRSVTGLPSPDKDPSPAFQSSTHPSNNSSNSSALMPSMASFLTADQYSNGDCTATSAQQPRQPFSPAAALPPPPLPSRVPLRERRRAPQLEHPLSPPRSMHPIGLHPLLQSQSTNTTTTDSSSESATGSITAALPATQPTATSNGNGSETQPSDLVQHCLLFPTYATRHSRSGSKDPHDWNIRVRGWAFSKRSNRRKRLVMSMARKIAGVTRDDNKLYETLESRFGMFLASNSKNARFSVQCVGAAQTSHMELAGDPQSHDPTVNELLDEAQTAEGEKALKETQREKVKLRNAIWTGQDISQLQADDEEAPAQPATNTAEQTKDRLRQKLWAAMKAIDTPVQETPTQSYNDYRQSPYRSMEMKASTPNDYHQYPSHPETPAATEGESRLERLSRGAVMLKDTFKKYKTNILSDRFNSSTDSLSQPQSTSRSGSNVSDGSSDEGGSFSSKAPSSVNRTESDDSVQTQSHTHPEDLGHGMLPTVQISTRIGGHFHGTLRVTVEEAAKMARGSDLKESRFLKLQAFHEDMSEQCRGVVNLIDPEGISIISDIDDTIKETNVPAGTRIILRNTFLSDMQEVEGMAHVYKDWWDRGAAIHYVSNSPWQLIPSLLDFFHSHEFPPGSAHLRLHDSVIKTYFMTPGEHKRRSIREILEDFPDRKFILVGDSGEIDLEIYTEMAVQYPQQIRKIFIRDITTARLQEMVARMPTTRSPSFSSLIQKVPVTAVTSRLSFLVNRNISSTNVSQVPGKTRTNSGSSHDSNSGANGSSSNSSDSNSSNSGSANVGGIGHAAESEEDEKNVFSEEPMAMDEAQSNTASRERRQPRSPTRTGSLHHNLEDLELDPSEPRLLVRGPTQVHRKPDASVDEYPFPNIDDPNTLHLPGQYLSTSAQSGTSPTWTPGQSPLHSPQWGATNTTTDHSGASTAPPVAKNPLEVWLDRVEACRRQLPEGVLTFFETSEALEQDPLIQQLFHDFERGQSKP